MKKQILIATKMYDYRDTVKKFYGEEYDETIKPFAGSIKSVMKKHKCNAIEAMAKIGGLEKYKEADGLNQLLFIAASVEIAEMAEQTKE